MKPQPPKILCTYCYAHLKKDDKHDCPKVKTMSIYCFNTEMITRLFSNQTKK